MNRRDPAYGALKVTAKPEQPKAAGRPAPTLPKLPPPGFGIPEKRGSIAGDIRKK